MKLTIWGKIENRSLKFSDNNSNRLRIFTEKKEGEDIKATFEFLAKPKSEEFLGFYWGGLLPAYVAHNKFSLKQDQLDSDPFLLSRLCKEKKITADEIEDAHRTFMYEYAPRIVYNLDGKPRREGGKMSDMNNTEAIKYSVLVYDYMQENGMALPNNELYKQVRDSAELIKESGL